MLLGGITGLSVVFSVIFCALSGGFGALGWLWMLPVYFAGSWLVLLALAFGFLWFMAQIVDLSVPQEKDSAFYRKMAYLYIDALIALVRLRVEVRGLEKTPKDGRFLLVCNHLNESDPGILLSYFRRSQLAFISKKENSSMFVVGKIMHRLLCQTLDRDNDRDALRCILKCIQLIRDDEASVAVFPEGYIYGDHKLHPFRSGVFKIAQKTQVPIVVCTLQGTQHLFGNLRRLKPTKARLHLVEVIAAEELKGRTTVEIAKRVHELMAADMDPEYRMEEQNT